MSDSPRELQSLAEGLVGPSPEVAEPHDCPDGSLLWDAAADDLEPSVLGEVVDHVAQCPACAHELQTAHGLIRDMDTLRPSPTTRRPRPSWRSLAKPWLLSATAAMFPLAILMLVFLPPSVSDPRTLGHPPGVMGAVGHPYGTGSVQRTVDGNHLQLLVPDGHSLSRGSFDLHWRGLPEARYEVHLTDLNLQPVATVWDLEQPNWQVPEGHLASLSPGTVLLWQVFAYLPDGRRIDSATWQLEIRETRAPSP